MREGYRQGQPVTVSVQTPKPCQNIIDACVCVRKVVVW